LLPGAPTETCSTSSLLTGAGKTVVARRAGNWRSVLASRAIDCRAAVNPRQLAIAISIGASARPIMIDDAIMAPAESSCRITR
jgi:hypothetical protein